VAIMTSWVPLATELLEGSSTSIVASVSFPLGSNPTASKVTETRWAVKHGRDDLEVDMVMNIPWLKSRNYQKVEEDVRSVVDAAEGHTTKVIIETPLLTPDEIVIACLLAQKAGINFIKTSTGFKAFPGIQASTVEHVKLIRKTVGDAIRIKIAGGVFTTEKAIQAIEAGVTRIGTIAGIPIVEGLKKIRTS
ncbi:MAG TPA: deoxyribose-phosphate aldolase, partial [Anaerolineales bacterium]|nr:deoxyribose-phosphate aldolase [Anaerolineales bacterium]